MIAKAGEEQVKIWRRSFDVPPPPVAPGSQYDPSMDRRYAGVDVPRTESLKDTIARVLPDWNKSIAPALTGRERVLLSAHGTSLRALVKLSSNISYADLPSRTIPNGTPHVFHMAK